MKKRILLTGAAGFIGQNFLQHHKENKEVLILPVDRLDKHGYITLDEHGFQTIKRFGPTHIVHLAAISSLPECESEPVQAYENNVISTLKLLEYCREHPVKRFVFSSTSAVYENNDQTPFYEFDEVYPDLMYSTTKCHAEHLIRNFSKNYGISSCILRLFNVYGPLQDNQRTSPPLIPYIIRELSEGRNPQLFSNGEQKRDYIYVKDVINAINLALEHPNAANQTLNVCSGNLYSVQQIFEIVASRMNRLFIAAKYNDPTNFWEKYPKLKNMPVSRIVDEVNKLSCGSNSRIKAHLGWEPKYTMKEGIDEILSCGT